MKRGFISFLFFLTTISMGCSIPEKVKKGSTEIITAQQKFIEENNKFYGEVLKTITDCIEVSKERLKANIQNQISELPKRNLDKMIKDKRKEKNLSDTVVIHLSSDEQLLLLNITMKHQEALLSSLNEAIDTWNERIKRIKMIISLLMKYQGEIYNTMKSLDTYIQIKKLHETLWEDTKNLIGGKNDKIDGLIKTIDSLNN